MDFFLYKKSMQFNLESEKGENEMRKKRIVFFILINLFILLQSSEQKLELLLSKLLDTKESNRASLLNEIADLYLESSPELSFNYAQRAFETAKKHTNKYDITLAYRHMGTSKEHLNEYQTALEFLSEGLSLAEKYGFHSLEADISLQFGIVYIRLANYDSALEYLLSGLQICDKYQLSDLRGTALTYIGNVHYYLGNFDKALEYYLSAKQIFLNTDNIKGLARSLNSIGSIYNIHKDYEKALVYSLQSLEYIQKTDDRKHYVSFLNNIGIIYKNLEKYDKAFEYYNKTLEIKKELGDKNSIATSYLNIANLYFHLEQSPKALENLEIGYKYIQDIPTERLAANFLKLFSYVHASLGNFETAFDFQKQYDTIRENLYSDEKSNRIAEMEVKYETDRKEQQILLLEKDKKINYILRTFFIIGIILLLIIAFVAYSRYLLKFKANKALQVEIIERIRVEEELEKAKLELENRVKERTNELANANIEIEKTQREILFTLGEVVETRSEEVSNHVKRVAVISTMLAEKIGMSAEETELLKLASPIHDLGKIGIPDNILNKPGKLTVEEFEIMKEHTLIGYELLKGSERNILRTAAIIALQHHEQWDGYGYPNGLKENEIHIFARITQLADIFDALFYKRTYKDNWDLEQILDFIREERGKRLDPQLVDLFIANIDEFIAAVKLYPDVAVDF
jgi:response regulator RpfG family c-di-GMP phosphodiesterase